MDEEYEWGDAQGDPAYEVEAVHEGEKPGLAFELVVEVGGSGVRGVGG